MAVTQTWTDPSTGGAIDLGTGDVLTETIYDKILSNLKHIAGASGFSTTLDATRGIQPASGHFMGAAAVNHHVEGGTVNVTRNAGRTGSAAVTFANAYASAPNVVATPGGDNSDGWKVTSISTTGCTINDLSANTDTIAYYWHAEGAD